MFIEVSGREDPAGGYEVLSKPPLGKCSINIGRAVRIFEAVSGTGEFLGTS
jgi:hypothetical protein